jgi:N-acylneuraminate cytidylyltransferase
MLLAPRIKMIQWHYFHGPKPFRYVLDKINAVDIDDALDLEVARAWLNYLNDSR